MSLMSASVACLSCLLPLCCLFHDRLSDARLWCPSLVFLMSLVSECLPLARVSRVSFRVCCLYRNRVSGFCLCRLSSVSLMFASGTYLWFLFLASLMSYFPTVCLWRLS